LVPVVPGDIGAQWGRISNIGQGITNVEGTGGISNIEVGSRIQ
jgi:hypothetical protein